MLKTVVKAMSIIVISVQFQQQVITVDKYLNCIITKYAALQLSVQESHLWGDLYANYFWIHICKLCK
jgi:hypothetical protein